MKKQFFLNLGPKMLYLCLFGLEVQKATVRFEFSTLRFGQLQNFSKKQKYLNLATKMPHLGIFELEF